MMESQKKVTSQKSESNISGTTLKKQNKTKKKHKNMALEWHYIQRTLLLLIPRVPRIGSRATETVTRPKQLLRKNK